MPESVDTVPAENNYQDGVPSISDNLQQKKNVDEIDLTHDSLTASTASVDSTRSEQVVKANGKIEGECDESKDANIFEESDDDSMNEDVIKVI